MLGGLASATMIWILSGLVSARPDALAAVTVAAVGTVAVARELGLIEFQLPQNRRQVPQTVFYKGRYVAPLQFGFEMGTGVRTYTTAAAPYVLAMTLLMVGGSWLLAIAAGVGFGSGRALMPLSRYLGDEDAWDDTLAAHAKSIGTVCTVACVVAALLLAGRAV